jgi:hypothetical protein
MSRLTRALALVTMLAAMTLTAQTAVAQAQPSTDDAARRQALAQERYYESFGRQNLATQAALAQERYYSTWGYGAASAPAPAQPGGQPAWLVFALAVLAAVLALVAGVAVLAARRAIHTRRASQTA